MNASEAFGTIEAPPQPLIDISRRGRVTPWLAWLLAWGTKGSLAITDQALFAGAQFALNILLARWLAPAGYGAFAVAYSVYLLAIAVHGALLVEPMIVFGSGRHFEVRRNYLGIVVRGHWLLTAPMSLILFGAGFLIGRLHSLPVRYALYALGFALPLTLLVELTRRAFYVEMRPGHAALGGVIYFCALMALADWMRAERILTPATAVIAMGVAALLTASVQLMRLRSQWPPISRKVSARSVASEHWGYGRWVLAAVFPSWTLLNLLYVVLPVWFGLKESGALKAIMNLAMPATHSLIAFGMLMMPLLVRHRDGGGHELMRRTVRQVACLFVAGAALYSVTLWLFRVQIINLLYGGKYLEYSGMPVLLVGLVPLVTAYSVVFGAALRAFERPDRVFWANVAASAVSLTFSLWLTATLGVLGAVAGYVASYGVLASVLWLLYQRLRPREAWS
jgi:O-antigen/teichoic acid export membrane protein